MRILLIGGTGIISSEIAARALYCGYSVTVINRGIRSAPNDISVRHITADVRKESFASIRNKIGQLEFDVVVDFISYNAKQLQKTLNVIKGKCKQIVFISSATVYKQKNIRFKETSSIGNEEWKYALDKSCAEIYLSENASKYNLKYTIIRPYITYGVTRIPLQFGPLQYYTLINRMANEKPIAVFGRDVRCTLTTAEEFAVGAVGLFLNENSYGEIFHITGDCEITWGESIKIIEKAFNVKAQLIEVPTKLLINKASSCGLDCGEIVGDKGRSMVFDNTKIKTIVPEFQGAIQFKDAISGISTFYNNQSVRNVNYAWDARCDRLISYIDDLPLCVKRKLNFSAYKNDVSAKDEIIYRLNRNPISFSLLKTLKKIIKQK